ncbi:Patatin-like phospholipase [Carboxydocella thermautotrophica]|nr:Patatin-like phospholipase [Carboxydocella thermautotrophica]
MSYCILCFDGGGVRGIYASLLLQRLSTHHPALLAQADLLAGTSSGSFIALALAAGLTPERLLEFFSVDTAKQIFRPRYFNLWRPRYQQSQLKKVLEQIFPPDLCLKDLRKKVVIPTFQVAQMRAPCWQPIFYHNFPDSPYLNLRVLDVALASSAAPTFFPAHRGHIDGGVIANNPSLVALGLAVDPAGASRELKEIVLLSIGTGLGPHRLPEHTEHWGILQWTFILTSGCQVEFPLLTVLTEGDVEADARIASSLLGHRYFRLNPLLPRSVALDAWEMIPLLLRWAKEAELAEIKKWLNQYW